jgi:hydrogenase nickel incorporation protein HypA/HybF
VHELSLADAVVRTVRAHAGDRRVAKVELKVGYLRQVVPAALAFAFELVAAGTPVEGAELALVEVPARVVCRACRDEHDVREFPFACRSCRSLDVDVVAGEDLLVEYIELDDAPSPLSEHAADLS